MDIIEFKFVFKKCKALHGSEIELRLKGFLFLKIMIMLNYPSNIN